MRCLRITDELKDKYKGLGISEHRLSNILAMYFETYGTTGDYPDAEKLSVFLKNLTEKNVIEVLSRTLGDVSDVNAATKALGQLSLDLVKNMFGSGDYMVISEQYYREHYLGNTGAKFKNDQSEVFGFVEKSGRIVLIKEKLNPNTIAHEYAHLYFNVMKKKAPNMYRQWMGYAMEDNMFEKIKNSEAYAEIKDNNDEIASELLARYVGERSESYLKACERANGSSFMKKIKEFIESFFKFVKTMIDNNYDDSATHSKRDIVNSVVYDFLRSKNPNALIIEAVREKRVIDSAQDKAELMNYPIEQQEGLARCVAYNLFEGLKEVRDTKIRELDEKTDKTAEDRAKLASLKDRDKGLQTAFNDVMREKGIDGMKEIVTNRTSNLEGETGAKIHNAVSKFFPQIYDMDKTRSMFKNMYALRPVSSDDETVVDDDDFDEEEETDNSAYGEKISDENPMNSPVWITQMIGSLLETDENGNIITDEFGPKPIDPKKAYAVLLNHFSDSVLENKDFAVKDKNGNWSFPTLEALAKQPEYRFVKTIIRELGNDQQKIAGFYTNFYKSYMEFAGCAGGSIHVFNHKDAVQTGRSELFNAVSKGSILNNEIDAIGEDGTIITANKNKAAEMYNMNPNSKNKPTADDYVRFFATFRIRVSKERIEDLMVSPAGKTDLKDAVDKAKELKDSIYSDNDARLRAIFNAIGQVSAPEIEAIGRINGKPKYSYVLVSYAINMVRTLSNTVKKESISDKNSAFQRYLEKFRKDSFFYDKASKRFLNPWLRALASTERVADDFVFDNKRLAIRNCVMTAQTYNKKEYMRYTTTDLIMTELANYFQQSNDYAYYAMTIPSSSPNYMFIQGPKISDLDDGSKAKVLANGYYDLFEQELVRMRRIGEREGKGQTPIKNYDKNGKKFTYLTKLNSIKIDGKDVLEAIDGKNGDDRRQTIDRYINQMLNDEYEDYMEYIKAYENDVMTGFFADWYTKNGQGNKEFTVNGKKKKAEKITKFDKLSFGDEEKKMLKEYVYNRFLANAMIKQLTNGDEAFFKNDNAVDEQKRAKEAIASGLHLFKDTDEGRKTSRVVYLKDEEILSSSYTSIKNCLEQAYKEGRITKPEMDFYLSSFDGINLADAQAYRSFDSYVSVLSMQGALTGSVRATIDRIKSNQWTAQDLYTVFQTIKPFVYTRVNIPTGDGDTILTPVQHKNSEFLILASVAYASGSGKQSWGRDISKSDKLLGIDMFMKENNIDVVMFESALKAGMRKTVDIRYDPDKVKDFIKNHPEYKGSSYDEILDKAKKKLEKGDITQDDYNGYVDEMMPNAEKTRDILASKALLDETDDNGYRKLNIDYADEIDYDDYMIASRTPEHIFDTKVICGSQFNSLIISEIPDNFETTIDGVKLGKTDVIRLWRKLKSENILDSYKKLLGKMSSIEELQKHILQTIDGNPKYDQSLKEAFEIIEDSEGNKMFRLPVDFPTYRKSVESLLTSLFRNKITKQYIRGANCILTANVGLNSKLNLKYKEDGALDYAEVMMPAYSRPLMDAIATKNEDGTYTFDKEILESRPELFEGIFYRIPTESYHSMCNFRIVGFLSENNGSSIMLPADIVTMAGSDFDVDKVFIMLNSLRIPTQKQKVKRLAKEYYYEKTGKGGNDKNFNEWFNGDFQKSPDNNPEYDRIKNTTVTKEDVEVIPFEMDEKKDKEESDVETMLRSVERNSVEARNNMLLKVARAILSDKKVSYKCFQPNNYKNLTVIGKFMDIVYDRELSEKFGQTFFNDDKASVDDIYDALQKGKISAKAIKKFISDNERKRSSCSPIAFFHFHKQNAIGQRLIGIYANNITNPTKFQLDKLRLKYQGLMYRGNPLLGIDNEKDADGISIFTNMSEMSAAAVDNEKDPVCTSALQTEDSAKITNLLLRMGVTLNDAVLFLGRPSIRELILNGKLDTVKNMTFEGNVEQADLDGKTSLERIMSNEESDSDLKLLKKVLELADELKGITLNSKQDTTNGGIKTTFASAMSQIDRIDSMVDDTDMNISGYDGYFGKSDKIDDDVFTDVSKMREYVEGKSEPQLAAFYMCGVLAAKKLLGRYVVSMGDKGQEYMHNVIDELGIEETTDNFYNDVTDAFLGYIYSKTQMFGDDSNGGSYNTYAKKRDYYLNRFVSEYASDFIKDHSKTVEFIHHFIRVQDGKVIINGPIAKTPEAKAEFERQFLLMAKEDSTREFAVHLVKYAYYRNALNFSRDGGYSHLLSPAVLLNIPNFDTDVRDAISKFNKNDGTSKPEFLYNLVRQKKFLANGYIKKVKDKADFIDNVKRGYKSLVVAKDYAEFSYIMCDNTLYMLEDYDKGTFVRVDDTVDNDSYDFTLFNRQKTAGNSQASSSQSNDAKIVSEIPQALGIEKETTELTVKTMQDNSNPEMNAADKVVKTQAGGSPLKVVLASEHTDPASHSEYVCNVIKNDIAQSKLHNTPRKYRMMRILTKHDGKPLLDMLELDIPKSVHFSITGLGGTKWEPGVMKTDDLFDRIEELVKRGKLNPNTTTIRIDPIVPGVTTPNMIEHVMLRATKLGISNFKISIMDSYDYKGIKINRKIRDTMQRLGYNFDENYDSYFDANGVKYHKQHAKEEKCVNIYNTIESLAEKYSTDKLRVKVSTCAEPEFGSFKHIKFKEGCLSVHDVNSALGSNYTEDDLRQGEQRPKCHCLGNKEDILRYDDSCISACAYCYANHQSDEAHRYYDDNGKLINDKYTNLDYVEGQDNFYAEQYGMMHRNIGGTDEQITDEIEREDEVRETTHKSGKTHAKKKVYDLDSTNEKLENPLC